MNQQELNHFEAEANRANSFIDNSIGLYEEKNIRREIVIALIAGDAIHPLLGRWKDKVSKDHLLEKLEDRNYLVAALLKGLEQLVNWGAGLDTLKRFTELPPYQVFYMAKRGEEVLPALIKLKECAGNFSTLLDGDVFTGPKYIMYTFKDEYSVFSEDQ